MIPIPGFEMVGNWECAFGITLPGVLPRGYAMITWLIGKMCPFELCGKWFDSGRNLGRVIVQYGQVYLAHIVHRLELLRQNKKVR